MRVVQNLHSFSTESTFSVIHSIQRLTGVLTVGGGVGNLNGTLECFVDNYLNCTIVFFAISFVYRLKSRPSRKRFVFKGLSIVNFSVDFGSAITYKRLLLVFKGLVRLGGCSPLCNCNQEQTIRYMVEKFSRVKFTGRIKGYPYT